MKKWKFLKRRLKFQKNSAFPVIVLKGDCYTAFYRNVWDCLRTEINYIISPVWCFLTKKRGEEDYSFSKCLIGYLAIIFPVSAITLLIFIFIIFFSN